MVAPFPVKEIPMAKKKNKKDKKNKGKKDK
jgi:hypothetical protein